jgi:hypothetical protein
VDAGYLAGSGRTAKYLTFSGMYGTIGDPEKDVDAMLAKSTQKETHPTISGHAASSLRYVM